MENKIENMDFNINNKSLFKGGFWSDLERQIRRTEKFIHWKIQGQYQHGISPMMFPDLTPERVEEIYNVNFGD